MGVQKREQKLTGAWRQISTLRRFIFRGAVVEDGFYKARRLSVQAGNRDKILSAHMQRICQVHDTVIRSYHQQIQRSYAIDAKKLKDNFGEQVYV